VARSLFTQEQVFEAADSIADEGKEVTALALLSKLGGASLTTIYKHLIPWRAKRQNDAAPATTQTIPESVQAAFASALGTVWRVATTEAGKEVVAAKDKAAEEVASATKQFEEAMLAIERMEEQADADSTKIESLSARVAELEAALQKSENERAASNAATEELRHQAKSQEASIERFHKDLETERRDRQEEVARVTLKSDELVQTANRAREEAVKEAAVARGQVEALKQQNSELLSKVAESGKNKK
jgi:hypothetical protein